MPIEDYGVLKGKAFLCLRATAGSEHFQVLIKRGRKPHRIAINTKSSEAPSRVLYYAKEDFHHEITDVLQDADLEDGFTPLLSKPAGLALDFLRSNLFDVSKMISLPSRESGDNDDLNDHLDFFVQQAISDERPLCMLLDSTGRIREGLTNILKKLNQAQECMIFI